MGEVSEGSLERAFNSFAKNIEKGEKMANRVGTEKLCPLMTFHSGHVEVHCFDDCEWNDGEGCAVWRFVKLLEKMIPHTGTA